MEVNFELTQAEYEHLNRRCIKERQGKLMNLIFLGFAVFNFLTMRHRSGDIGALLSSLIITAGLSLFMMVFFRVLVRGTFKAIRRTPSWGPVRVRLEPGAVETANPVVKSEIRWEGLARIAEDSKAFYLYLNPLQIVMIPRRVFASAQEAQTFWNLTQEYYQYARKTPVSRSI